MLSRCSYGTRNVVFLAICFLLLFSADLTLQNFEKTLISSVHDDKPEFTVDGYHLLAMLYISFGLSLWFGPSAVSILGLRTSMSFASLLYTIYIVSFALEEAWVLYAMTFIGGIGAGILWAAEGKYLVLNSTPELVSRNIGIFYTFYCSSTFFGNVYAYKQLYGKTYMDKETRQLIVFALTGLAAFATIAFIFLRPVNSGSRPVEEPAEKKKKSTALGELKKTWAVFTTKEMLLLSVTFCYTGMQQAFNSGIYSPSIGFTLEFGNTSKQLVPLSGIFIGIGQLTSGIWQMALGKKLGKLYWGRRIVNLIAVLSQFVAYAIIFINIPASAVFGSTHDKAIIKSNVYLAMLCSTLLGIGDGSLNTQNFSIIAFIFPDESAQSCALYKFTKAIFVAVGFFLSSRLDLQLQLMILIPLGIVAVIMYTCADRLAINRHKATSDEKNRDGIEIDSGTKTETTNGV